MSDMLRRVAMMMRASPSVTYATWNPADKDASISLSGGNLIYTGSGSASTVRSTISKATDKWYWENTINTAANAAVGVTSIGGSLSTFPGGAGATTSWGYLLNGNIYNNGSIITSVATFTNGDIISCALDVSGGTLAFRKNNTLVYTASLVGSTYFAAGGGPSGSPIVTTNFGATAFVYSPPVGYNAGMYT